MGNAAAVSATMHDYQLSPEDRRLLSHPRTARPSELLRVARQANRLRDIVESSWHELPEDLRTELVHITYLILDPPRTLRRRASEIVARLSMAYLVIREGPEALSTYVAAVRRLVNAVLTAVERDSERYQNELREALGAPSRELSEQEFGDWLTEVSSRAE